VNGAAGRYTGVARLLHWTTAVLVIAMIPAGFVLMSLPAGAVQDTAFNLHRSTGVLLFALTLFRIGWRLGHPPPPLPAGVPAAQRAIAHLAHLGLYALLLAMPVIGWWATSAYGAPIIVFGLFELPPLVAQDRALSERLFALHGYAGIALALLIVAHAGAALHHHFSRRDGVLQRML
jgi:cytochrome b561